MKWAESEMWKHQYVTDDGEIVATVERTYSSAGLPGYADVGNGERK